MFNKKELEEKSALIKQLEEALESKGTHIALLEKEAVSREERINLIEKEAAIKEKRHLAEFDNFRKRKDKELENSKKFANEKVLIELLAIADCLEQYSKYHKKDEGVIAIYNLLQNTFGKYGLTGFNPLGEIFDPTYHSAVSTISSEKLDNVIVEVYQNGYMYHDRLLRPASVVVAKKDD